MVLQGAPARLIVDLDDDGTVTVSTAWGDGEQLSAAGRAALSWPLGEEALEDLRWYLEDYLLAPFGVYEDRGARVGASLGGWGETVFSSVFGSGPARDAYLEMRARGDVEVVFRSASPSLLGLPWELMADPARGRPLALEVAGVSRSLPLPPDPAQTVAAPGGRLRVLMVISRPAGAGDVGYRMIARPLLERLEAVRGTVDVVVLRPPTLDALSAELASAAAAGRPYQVVHFDGHGVMPGRHPGPGGHVPGDEGMLVFEAPGGGAYHASASRVARLLASAKVPVVVLNACQSAAMGKDLEAAVATRLLGEGIASVVAMAFSVYAVAAAEFMAAFYEKLFAGGTVSAAVTAGRLQMRHSQRRPSPKGDMPLQDWLVPVHYFRREVRFPQAAVPRPAELPSLAVALEEASAAQGTTSRGDLDAVNGVFVGRDGLFYDLEAAARLDKVVVLAGAAGTGKTELAKAFARWWRDTNGTERPDWVFWHSFEPGVASFGLDGVISQVGIALYGEQFALQEEEQRQVMVLDALAKHRMLLVWDNFEAVRSMPDPGRATPPLDEPGCDKLRDFLAAVAAASSSSVLVTSRTGEDWLGRVRRIRVGGLAAHEAAEYAGHLLAPYPAARRQREKRAFGDLMRWLDGHPLSMRLVLPRLDSDSLEALLAGLRGTAPLPGDDAEAGRTESLAASVAYSYAHMAPATRRSLPAVSLLHGVADVDVLADFSQAPDAPGRFAGIGRDEWEAALDDATVVGLLASLGGGLYRVHPALPGYLAAAWQAEEPLAYAAARAAATRALVTAHAAFGRWLSSQIEAGDAGLAHEVIGLEHGTLSSLLGLALDYRLWDDARMILEPLDLHWTTRGLHGEADAWAGRARAAAEAITGSPPRPDTPAGKLWLFTTARQANGELVRHHLDHAEAIYRQVMSVLEAMAVSPQQQRDLATAYHQLGIVAQDRGDLESAADWYRKALALAEELGYKQGMARTCHHLAIVAQGQRDPGVAEGWSRKALALQEQLGDRPGMARTFHQLGIVAQDQGDLRSAADWYRKALALAEELGYRQGMAVTFHQLGNLAQDQGAPESAENWYRKALLIKEELGDRQSTAVTYCQLGNVAQDRGDLSTAENWYRGALALEEQAGDRPGMAMTYRQLGLVAQDRGDLSAAENWYREALALQEELGDRPSMTGSYFHLGLMAQLRADLGSAGDRYRKALALAEELADRPGMVRIHHQLGIVAHDAGDLGTAEDQHRKALALAEELADRPGMVKTYHELGVVAQSRGDLGAAGDWYREALALAEELGDGPGMALTCAQSGRLAAQRGQPAEALAWMVRGVSLFDEFPHPSTGPAPRYLAQLTGWLGMPALERTWQQVTGERLPRPVRDYVADLIQGEDGPD